MPFRRGATAGEYASLLRIPAPDCPECGRRSAATPGCRRAALVPFQPGAGLLVACLVCVGCLGWNTVLQLRLRRWQRTEADLSGRLALKQALVDGIPYPVSIRTPIACWPATAYLESLRMTREQARGLLTDSDWVGAARHGSCTSSAWRWLGRTASFTDMAVRIGGQLLEIHHWVTPYRDRQGRVLGLMNAGSTSPNGSAWPASCARRCARRTGESGEERLPGDHEPRDPYADECGHRHPRTGCRWRRSSANAPRWRSPTRLRGRCNCSSATSSTSPRSSPATSPERVRLRHVVESVRRMFEGLARQKGLRLVVELDDAPGRTR